MKASELMKSRKDVRAPVKARVAGLLYLLIFIVAPSGAITATPWRLITTFTCDVAVAFLLCDLLRPVSKTLSLLAAIFRLIFVVVMGLNSLNFFGLLRLFGNAGSDDTFNLGYGIALIPFGVHCLLTGYLIFRSAFLPRLLGILMATAGLAYSLFLWPSFGLRLFFPYIAIPGVLGEGSLTLWLLIKGVNGERWEEQASSMRPFTGGNASA